MTADRTHADELREALDWTRDTEEYSDTLAALDALLADLAAANKRAERAERRYDLELARAQKAEGEAYTAEAQLAAAREGLTMAMSRLTLARASMRAALKYNEMQQVEAWLLACDEFDWFAEIEARAALAASPPDTGDTA